MRHLKGTLDFTLYIEGKDITLRGFCNAEWVEDAPRGTHFLLALESFHQNTRNNQSLHEGSSLA